MSKVLKASFGKGTTEASDALSGVEFPRPLDFVGEFDSSHAEKLADLASRTINVAIKGVNDYTLGDVFIMSSVSIKLERMLKLNPAVIDQDRMIARKHSLAGKRIQTLFSLLHNCDDERLQRDPVLYCAILLDLERRGVSMK